MPDVEWQQNGRPILGIGHVPNRKRPFLYVQEGVHAEVVAYLQSEAAAEKGAEGGGFTTPQLRDSTAVSAQATGAGRAEGRGGRGRVLRGRICDAARSA